MRTNRQRLSALSLGLVLVVALACSGTTSPSRPADTSLPPATGAMVTPAATTAPSIPSSTTIPEPAVSDLGLDVLANLEYKSEFTQAGTAPLSAGRYVEPAAPGSATDTIVAITEHVALGQAPGGHDAAAIILVSDPGGSGTFYELAVVLDESGQAFHVASTSLGDRVRINSLELDDGVIELDMVTHGTADPMCCPTQRVVQTYELQGGDLVRTSSRDIVAATEDGSALSAHTWTWVDLFRSEQGEQPVFADPESYSLQFADDGSIVVQAGCNVVAGIYETSGSMLVIDISTTTMAACEDDQTDELFLELLTMVDSFAVDSGLLTLALGEGGGQMMFGSRSAASGDDETEAAGISLDALGVANTWQAQAVPAAPYDNSQPPGPAGLPEHIQIVFDTDLVSRQPGDPVIYIIPLGSYEDMWQAQTDPSVTIMLDEIQMLLAERPEPLPSSGLPVLPFEELAGTNDLAVQGGYVDSDSMGSLRFVGRFSQDANPVTNQGLTYVSQGMSADGAYLVALFYPVSTSALPEPGDITAKEQKRLDSDLEGYLADQVKALNALDPSDWQPDLGLLDAMVASLDFSSAFHGQELAGTQWQWSQLLESEPSEQSTVPDPEIYTIAFGTQGDLRIQADCNMVRGEYQTDGNGISIEPGRSTWAYCGEGSLDQEFVALLSDAGTYGVETGRLFLTLKSGDATLILDPSGEPAGP